MELAGDDRNLAHAAGLARRQCRGDQTLALHAARYPWALADLLSAGVPKVVSFDRKQADIGAAMAVHPDVGKLAFTGPCATGPRILSTATQKMKRLRLEMGGTDAGIVLPDCDLKAIFEGLFWGAFVNNGQTCAAMKWLYVRDAIHDAVCEKLFAFACNIPVGNGMDKAWILGPVANRRQFDKVSRLVADAPNMGRVLLGGGPDEGWSSRSRWLPICQKMRR